MSEAVECGVPSCKKPPVATCCWRMHTVGSDGARIYTGKLCGLQRCEDHVRMVNGKPLCLWHETKANEQGLGESPPAPAQTDDDDAEAA